MARGNRPDEYIDRLVGAFTDPLIVYSHEWAETIPEWIKYEITIERMARLYKQADDDYATNAECVAYLYTASLCAPMGHYWTNIYLYLAGMYMMQRRGQNSGDVDDEWVPKEISAYEQGQLMELKHWIRQQQKKAVREKKRASRVEEIEAEQMKLFE